MLSLLLSGIVVALLSLGCYYDYKERRVSNLITGTIMLMSLPLVYMNMTSGELFNPLFALGGLIAMAFVVGVADSKVLLPIFFSISMMQLFLFLMVFSIVGYAYVLTTKKKDDVPVFIPITIAYVVVMLFA